MVYKKMEASFYSVELGIQTLWVSFNKEERLEAQRELLAFWTNLVNHNL